MTNDPFQTTNWFLKHLRFTERKKSVKHFLPLVAENEACPVGNDR